MRPLVWGEHDCCTFAADWALLQGNPDPMARWRGDYDSEEAARKIIDNAGGLELLWALGCIEAEMPEPDTPAIGDIGVVNMLTENGMDAVGAIYGGKRWHMLSQSGLFSASVEPLLVFRV